MSSGKYISQPDGCRAFIPNFLPPRPPLEIGTELTHLLSRADSSLGRLDGVASVLPNPDLFVAMYVRQEAVLSSQIEGTQSTLEDVLQFEIDPTGIELPKDIAEVINYIGAMNYGLNRVKQLPVSLRLLREIHERLLQGVRGGDKNPGEFRTTQNWIGPAGSTPSSASYVPPPVNEMHPALENLEEFLHDDKSYPVLIHCALAHAQFETIHPFADGNGRLGRLLITFLLCQRDVLHKPLLYLSHYLKLHRAEYYDRLMGIRNDGSWEEWLKFFLTGIYEVSEMAVSTARAILRMQGEHKEVLMKSRKTSGHNSLRLLDFLFKQPLVTTRMVQEHLNTAYDTAGKVIAQFERLGILGEVTGRQRNRRYRYTQYVKLFHTAGSNNELTTIE